LHRPAEDAEIRGELMEVQRDSYHMVAPRLVSSITSRFARESVLFTDGSRFEGRTGFGVFHCGNYEFGLRLTEPSGVFTAELTAILYALIHIKTHPPGRFLILTDSMSSVCSL